MSYLYIHTDVYKLMSNRRKTGVRKFVLLKFVIHYVYYNLLLYIQNNSGRELLSLSDVNLSSYKLIESLDMETEAFKNLVRDWTNEDKEIFLATSRETLKSMEALSYDYRQIGEERYAIT